MMAVQWACQCAVVQKDWKDGVVIHYAMVYVRSTDRKVIYLIDLFQAQSRTVLRGVEISTEHRSWTNNGENEMFQYLGC